MRENFDKVPSRLLCPSYPDRMHTNRKTRIGGIPQKTANARQGDGWFKGLQSPMEIVI